MPPTRFVSFAARCEDVVLQRALGRLPSPRFLELADDGVHRCQALENHGWAGQVVEADDDPPEMPGDVHALVVSPGSCPRAVSALHAGLRPWVVVAPAPSVCAAASELVSVLHDVDYQAALFDGASRYFVEPAHAPTLLPLLDHPAGPGDGYVQSTTLELEQQAAALRTARDELLAQVSTWRSKAVERWSETAADAMSAGRGGDAELLAKELEAMRHTLSWRVTKPLRIVRRGLPR